MHWIGATRNWHEFLSTVMAGGFGLIDGRIQSLLLLSAGKT
jgi:hypothetical protein